MSTMKVCAKDIRTKNDCVQTAEWIIKELRRRHQELTDKLDGFEAVLSCACGLVSTETGRRCWWDNRATKDNPFQEMYTIFFDEGVGEQLTLALDEIREHLKLPEQGPLTQEQKDAVVKYLEKEGSDAH